METAPTPIRRKRGRPPNPTPTAMFTCRMDKRLRDKLKDTASKEEPQVRIVETALEREFATRDILS